MFMAAGYVYLILGYLTEQCEKGEASLARLSNSAAGCRYELGNKTRETVYLREDDLL